MAPPNLPFDPADTGAPAPVPPARPPAPAPRPAPRPIAPRPAAPQPSVPAPEITAMPRPAGAKGEPEDIFSDLESPRATMSPPPSAGMARASSGGGRSGHTLVAVLALLIAFSTLGGALWFFVLRKAEPPLPSTTNTGLPTNETTPLPTDTGINADQGTPVAEPPYPVESTPFDAAPVTTPPDGVNIPPPTSVTGDVPPANETSPSSTTMAPETDSDGDGLSDRREIELGLDPQNPDGDADGLSDGDEVLVYGTNPSNPDTDGDAYLDGMEVKNGYDPRGTGTCAKPDCRLAP